jgi:hypothetical protein
MNIARSIEAGPPVLEEPRLAVVSTAGGAGEPEADAALKPGTTPEKGRSGAPRRRRPGAAATSGEDRAPATEPTPDAAPGVPDETLTAGAANAPGRRIHIRQLRAS